MPAFKPCYGCIARKTCPIKKETQVALRGSPVTSVKLKCDLFHSLHCPSGTRVLVKVWDYKGHDSWTIGGMHMVDVRKKAECMRPGTVSSICKRGDGKKYGKVWINLDGPVETIQGEHILCVSAYPKDLTLLDHSSPLGDLATLIMEARYADD